MNDYDDPELLHYWNYHGRLFLRNYDNELYQQVSENKMRFVGYYDPVHDRIILEEEQAPLPPTLTGHKRKADDE